jgi:hypothetical protein
MIKLSYTNLFTVVCFALCIGFVSSCNKDDDEANSGKVELFSFGPTGAKHGDTLRFIGINLDKVTAIQFTGTNATINQSDFKERTSELIRLIVPPGAEKGYVTLKTPNGDLVTKTQFNLNVKTTGSVTTMTTQARPGSNITINGNYLNWIKRITFNKDKVVSTFVSQSLNQLVVTVPADAQTGRLVLAFSGTDTLDYVTDTLKVTLPVSTSFSPNPVKPGTNVTITGTDLDLAKKVIFNGVTAPVTTFVSQTATQLVVKVPDAAKKGKLTLEALSGVQSVSANDLDIVLPAITTLSPNPINLGTTLTITGTDLDLVKKIIFSGFAQAATTFASQSSTQITLAVPAGSRDGQVKLEAASGVQTTSTGSLDIVLPSVTTMSPNPVFPATNLTITGTSLNMVTSVAFENAPAVTSFVSQSASQIVVTVPNGVLRGKITLGLSNPTDTIKSLETLEIGGGVPPPTVAFPIYNDAVTANWNGWIGSGWGGTKDLNNTSPVREGTKSCMISYNSGEWGVPLQLGGASISLAPYTTLKVSVYGGAGSNGKSINIGFNEVDGKTVTVVEGQWTDFAIPFSQISSATTLTHLYIKNYTSTGAYTIYIDALGLN